MIQELSDKAFHKGVANIYQDKYKVGRIGYGVKAFFGLIRDGGITFLTTEKSIRPTPYPDKYW